ncbi:MAG: hypothetical protein LPK14_04945 [Hymenobacteraceae bacterium]|nr:hypothetical protein [Hymenobacteraceae bacterium]
MKKATVIAFAIATFGIISTQAKAQSNTNASSQRPQTEQTQTTPPQQDANKQQITEEELPEAVKQALQADALKEWRVVEVYKVNPAPQGQEAGAQVTKATYEIFFTNAENKRAVGRFDEEGKAIANEQKAGEQSEQTGEQSGDQQ